MRINVFETSNNSVHITMFTVPGISEYPYQQIAVNSASMFVTVCLGDVANGVTVVLESCIQCLRYSAIFCMGFFLILQ